MSAAETFDGATAPVDDSARAHAHAAAAHGLRVIAVAPASKRPLHNDWPDIATTDPATIDRRWEENPDAGVGIVAGPSPAGNIGIVDVDEHGTVSGGDSLAELERINGRLPDTVEALTGGDGRHVYLEFPAGLEVRNGQIAPGVDIKAARGFVVAPPSLHPETGRAYHWEHGHAPWEHPIAPAPDWLVNLVIQRGDASSGTRPSSSVPAAGRVPLDETPADYARRTLNMPAELTAAGFQRVRTDRNGDSHYTRPGKDPRQGTSAVLHPTGAVTMFSTDPGLDVYRRAGKATAAGTVTLSPFDFYTAARHGGDHTAAGRQLRGDMLTARAAIHTSTTGTAAPTTSTPPIDAAAFDVERVHLVDWHDLYNTDHDAADWLLEPLIAAHRGTAFFAPGGTGKSLLALWLAVQIATGGTGLSGHPVTAVNVLYLDYEMTAADLLERVEAMGYQPDDLARLHYAQLPDIDPLDTEAGGRYIARLAEHLDVQLVVFDTFGRAVAGDENDADTVRDFYRHTGLALKAAGRAFIRVDHAGKDLAKGQRGSSAKNDDVDIVWQLIAGDHNTFTARTKKRRMGWVPETVALVRHDDPLRYTLAAGTATWPAGTASLADVLDDLAVPLDLSRRKAAEALRAAGHKFANSTLNDALRYRRNRPVQLADHPADHSTTTAADRRHGPPSPSNETPPCEHRTTLRTTADHPPRQMRTTTAPVRGPWSAAEPNDDPNPTVADPWNPFT